LGVDGRLTLHYRALPSRSVSHPVPGRRPCMILKLSRNMRRAVAAVETAMVLMPMTMFLFGVFVFCQLFLNWNLLNNAAREGCRYALVNNTKTTISSDLQGVVNTYMTGESSNFTSISSSVSGTH